MATFADGGAMMTKPYAGGGNYVDKMSTYCTRCPHEPRSCPVTALYWDFMARNADAFSENRRMRGPLQGLRRMDPERLAALREHATAWADAL